MQVSIDRMDNRCISKTQRTIAYGCAVSLLGLLLSFGLAQDGAIASPHSSLGCCRDSHHASRATPMHQHKQKKPNASASPPQTEPGDESTPDIDDIDRPDNEPVPDLAVPPLDGESDEGNDHGDSNGALDTLEPGDIRDPSTPANPSKPVPPETDVAPASGTAFPGMNQSGVEQTLITNAPTDSLPAPSLDTPTASDERPRKN